MIIVYEKEMVIGSLAYSHSVSSFQEVIKEKMRGGELTAVHLFELR